jgi:hypothetical protein
MAALLSKRGFTGISDVVEAVTEDSSARFRARRTPRD